MLDVCLLGCGGMMPLPRRWLTALMLRYNGSSILIDCGEGTQIAIKEKGWSFKPIDVICFTHYHGDHISGLPGLLLSMGNAERHEPLTLIGPKGLERVVNALRTIAPELPFEIYYKEIQGTEETFEMNGYRIRAFRVNHNVLCYGYTMEIDRAGKFDVERAKAANIPLCCWNPLQKGNVVEFEGVHYTPDMVLGEARKGIKLTYTTDTRPTRSIIQNAEHSDLFVCEGMYGEDDKKSKALEHKHMMFKEAADIKTSDQLHLPVPDAKFETVVVKPSEIQQDMVQALSERAAEVHSGSVDPSVDNMLKITSDGRKIGLDQRLMNSALPDDPNSKLNACVNNVLRIWNDTKEQKLTQLIFCDMSTPKGDGSFNVYDDIRTKLLNAGVPEQEIEFIHNADTENKKDPPGL